MKKEDMSIFEYRMGIEMKFTDLIREERLNGKYEKGTVRTKDAGPVDFMIYRPAGSREDEILPAVFSFHGGGFVLGCYEVDGKYCQRLADLSGCAVINMDYALAPEYKFPLPITSSYEAVCRIADKADQYRIDRTRLMVCGHSAGGAIAADICILDREEKKLNLRGQILDYAPLYQTLSEDERKVPDPDKAMPVSIITQYINWYFDDLSDMKNELASPVLADLSSLPAALIISAEFDSLSGEEKAFADKAAASGTEAEYHLFKGCMHGFTHLEYEYEEESAEKAWQLMSDFIRKHI